MAQQKVRIKIPKGFDRVARNRLGQEIITYIQSRAIDDNRGWNPKTKREKKFPKYTKEYAARKGTSRSNVDLVLTADMFNDMLVLRTDSESVTVGFKGGTESNDKAEGNQKGTYGQSRPIPGKARPFLGLPKSRVKEIAKRLGLEDDDGTEDGS